MGFFDRERTGRTGVCGLRSFLLPGLIAVAAMLPFLAAVGFGLVDLDDGNYLGDHPVLWEGSFIETVKFAFGAAHDAIWMPLTWLSYALDYRLWGEWWGGFHLHSIVVHAVNAGLVWALLREIFGADAETAARRRWTLVLLALVWAVHPLRCESVVFVASRECLGTRHFCVGSMAREACVMLADVSRWRARSRNERVIGQIEICRKW